MLNPIKILFIEDNDGDVELAREAFLKHGIRNSLEVCDNGKLALEYLLNTDQLPDLILLDLNIPAVGGREVLRKIRQDKRLALIPIVVFSSSSTDLDILLSYELGANCYVSKPLNAVKFIEAIKSIYDFWIKLAKRPG